MRRFAEMGGNRRFVRERGSGVLGAPTYRSILGPLLVEMWHSQLGIATVSGNVDTWTGQIGGRVIQAPAAAQRPVYGADGTAFGGKSVIQCAITGTKCLKGAGLTQLAAVGTRPWVLAVVRYRNATGTVPGTMAMGGASEEMTLACNPGLGNWRTYVNPATATDGAVDASVHVVTGWADGTNINVQVGSGAPVTGAGTGALLNACTGYVVGSAISTDVVISNTSHALHIVCSAYPGAAAAAAAIALASAEFPP